MSLQPQETDAYAVAYRTGPPDRSKRSLRSLSSSESLLCKGSRRGSKGSPVSDNTHRIIGPPCRYLVLVNPFWQHFLLTDHRANKQLTEFMMQCDDLQILFDCANASKEQAKFGRLKHVVSIVKASQSSVRDDWSFFRAVALLNAGKSWLAYAQKFIDAASWSDAFLLKATSAKTAFENSSNLSIGSLDGSFIDLRIACGDGQILAIFEGNASDDNDFKETIALSLKSLYLALQKTDVLSDLNVLWGAFVPVFEAHVKLVTSLSVASGWLTPTVSSLSVLPHSSGAWNFRWLVSGCI